MRIKLFLLMALVGTMVASAQVNWGVEAGVGASHAFDTNKSRTGFHVGVMGELNLPLGYFIDGSLRLTNRQWANYVNFGPEGTDVKTFEKANPYYLELPILVGKKFFLMPKLQLGAAIGPKIGVGLFGSYSYRPDGGEKVSYSNCFNGKSGASMGRFAAGAQAHIFLQVADHYRIGVEGDLMNYSKAKKAHPIMVKNAWQAGLNLTYIF